MAKASKSRLAMLNDTARVHPATNSSAPPGLGDLSVSPSRRAHARDPRIPSRLLDKRSPVNANGDYSVRNGEGSVYRGVNGLGNASTYNGRNNLQLDGDYSVRGDPSRAGGRQQGLDISVRGSQLPPPTIPHIFLDGAGGGGLNALAQQLSAQRWLPPSAPTPQLIVYTPEEKRHMLATVPSDHGAEWSTSVKSGHAAGHGPSRGYSSNGGVRTGGIKTMTSQKASRVTMGRISQTLGM